MICTFRRSRKNDVLGLTVGIWKSCVTLINTKTCFPIPCNEDNGPINDCVKLYGGRILFIGVCMITAISAFCLFLIALVTDDRNKFLLVLIKMLVLASLLMGVIVVSVILYSTRISLFETSLGTSAHLALIAIVINFIGTAFSLLI